jgi:hypothetical protein
MLVQASRRFLSITASIEASLAAAPHQLALTSQHSSTNNNSSSSSKSSSMNTTAFVTEELQLLQIKFKRLYASLRFTMLRETHLWYSSLNAVLDNIDAAEVSVHFANYQCFATLQLVHATCVQQLR